MSSSSDFERSSGFSAAGVERDRDRDALALALVELTSESSDADSDALDADAAGLDPDPSAAAAATDACSGDLARFSSLAGGNRVAGPTSCHAGRVAFFRFSRTGADFFFSARSTASASRTTEGVRARASRAGGGATPSAVVSRRVGSFVERRAESPTSAAPKDNPDAPARRAAAAELKRMVSRDLASPSDRTRDHRRAPPRCSSRASDRYRRS
mmetsp:Transcript_4848/g.20591  ORF Transcript_4848/g.20591 Transcript_4848/m.20591 type:complete len:213 (+) Transcript_4848:261-899(+)